MIYTRIVGTGSYLPEKILTNFDLEKMVDTSNQWIIERTGIKERHIVAEHEQSSDMAKIAALRAIEATDIDKDEIDLIIVCTATCGFFFPSAACILQRHLGIRNCPAFDVNAAGCSGFIYGLNIADQYIKNGTAECILFVASEALSKITDWQDRSTCVLFGDGAGAVVLKKDNQPGIRSTHVHADGSYQQLLYAPNTLYESNEKPYIQMRGNEVFRVAVNKTNEAIQEALEYNNLDVSEIDWLIPHQANLRIIKASAKKMKLPWDRIILTIQEHGNTSAASIALALDTAVRDGRIKHGDILLMEAFGSGFTWGSAVVDY